MKKKCSVCKKRKIYRLFHRNCTTKDGHQTVCRVCRKRHDVRRHSGKARLRYNARQKELRQQNPDRFHGYRIMSIYGISGADYLKLFRVQKKRCAICGSRPSKHRRLDVDHNHKTNRVRGLLCYKCNRMLGFAQDSKIILQNAIRYL